MAIRPIVEVPDPRLRQISTPVEGVDDELRALVADMFETMYEAPGIGLAAIQVGVPKRVLVIDLQEPEEEGGEPVKDPRVFINPEILTTSGPGGALHRGLPVGAGPICRGRPSGPHPRALARTAMARSTRKTSTACWPSASSMRWTI